jgi:hypothetical protein
MADDLSWIDHPANLRANAVLLRAVADQSLLHADEIERLRNMLDNVMSVRRHRGGTMTDMDRDEFVAQRSRRAMTDLVEWLRNSTSAEWNGPMLNKAADEIERLRAKLADIANSMKRDWQDPADHANWCIEHAKT